MTGQNADIQRRNEACGNSVIIMIVQDAVPYNTILMKRKEKTSLLIVIKEKVIINLSFPLA